MGLLSKVRLIRKAKRLRKRMLRTGDWSPFEELVAQLEDEDIERFLTKLDYAMEKNWRAATDPAVQKEYEILIEERARRDETGLSQASAREARG